MIPLLEPENNSVSQKLKLTLATSTYAFELFYELKV